MKEEFLNYWSTIKPLAMECAKHYPMMARIEAKGECTPEDEEIIKSMHDPLAAWNVGLLIGDISKGRPSLDLINSISNVTGTLEEGSTYWENVWDNDFSSQEAQNLCEFGRAVQKLRGLM